MCQANKATDGENIFSTFENNEESNFEEFTKEIISSCTSKLKRSLEKYEMDILNFPRVCNICKQSNVTLLIECDDCHSVFYCSDEHLELDRLDHHRWCSEYILNLKCNTYEAKNGIQDMPLPLDVDDTYTSLTDDIKTFLKPQLKPNDGSTMDHEMEIVISERLSYSLTLLYSLQKMGVGLSKEPLNSIEELKVHVVGATSLGEMLGIIRWEYMLHRLPALNKLHIVFIGPEIYKDVETDEDVLNDKHGLDDSGVTRCEDCVKKERVIFYEMANMTYHEFTESLRYSKPDTIISFNPQFFKTQDSDTNSWIPTLEVILDSPEIPLIFTSYTSDEANKDLEFIKDICNNFKTLYTTEKNPFCSLRPMRNSSKLGDPLFYSNQYLTCVSGS